MDSDKRTELLAYLKSSLEIVSSWIYRKEIAAWSSILLYFTGLFGIYTIIKSVQVNIVYSISLIIFVVLFGYLFGLFLYKQYGSLVSGLAATRALSFWQATVIKNKCDDINFDFTISSNGQFVSIKNKIDEEYNKIRQHRIGGKILIPFYLSPNLFRKKGKNDNQIKSEDDNQYESIEVQESVLYDMILLSTLFFVGYILRNANII